MGPHCPFTIREGRGAEWAADDRIIIAEGANGILRVPANGGKPETLVTLQSGEVAHSPQILPGGDLILFTVASGSSSDRWDKAQIVVHSLKTGKRQVVLEGGNNGRYVPTGHLVYVLGSTLLAVPFDLRSLRVTDTPAPIADGLLRTTGQTGGLSGLAQFTFSENGSFVYVPANVVGGIGERVLAFADKSGMRTAVNIPPSTYNHPRLSPNGKQLALQVEDATGQNIWIYDLDGAVSPRRLTFEGRNSRPMWTKDGERIVFTSDREGDDAIFWQRADGNGLAERLVMPEKGRTLQPESWAMDGNALTFSINPASGSTLWLLKLNVAEKPQLLVTAPRFSATNSAVAPGGKWLAYWSNEGARRDIYIQPLPTTGAKQQVSTSGNTHYPLWSPDGRQLFYVIDRPDGTGQIVSVDVQTQPTLVIGKTTPLPIEGIVFNGPRGYDITPDGKRFVVMLPRSQSGPAQAATEQINVTLNWFKSLIDRVPVQ